MDTLWDDLLLLCQICSFAEGSDSNSRGWKGRFNTRNNNNYSKIYRDPLYPTVERWTQRYSNYNLWKPVLLQQISSEQTLAVQYNPNLVDLRILIEGTAEAPQMVQHANTTE